MGMAGATIEDARAWLKRGAAVLPLPFRSKAPTIQAWQDLRLTEQQLPEFFNSEPCNIGLLLGKPSSNLVDVDCDWPEAARIAAMLLPATSIFGRASAPSSHRLYVAEAVTFKWRLPATFKDRVGSEERLMVLELRSTGAQTVAPPSVHPDGESVCWERRVKPSAIDGAALTRRCALVASGAVLARLAWSRGVRHDAALALAGAMLRSGWSAEEVGALVRAVAEAVRDESPGDRARAVLDTAKTLAKDRHATGLPTLAGLIGEELVGVLKQWLHLADSLNGIRVDGAAVPPFEEGVDDDEDVLRPEPMREDAFHGLAGRFVEMVAPETEACREALLLQLLVGAGCAFGRAPYFQVGADRHGLNEFAVLVGVTARGRKGSSLGFVERALAAADPLFELRFVSGLSTGEGLIHLVRDPRQKLVRNKDTGQDEEIEVDRGVADKRLLATCEELALVLTQAGREGNTLSPLLRQAWDGKRLANALRDGGRGSEECREPHVSLVAHITRAELRARLTTISMANGLANRCLFAYAYRARELPSGGGMPPDRDWLPFVQELRRVLTLRPDVERMARDEEAEAMWRKHYSVISAEQLGLLGALLARWEAHALRLSAIYAALDGVRIVASEHLHAALAVLDYCADSARYIFGAATGDAMAERIVEALRAAPGGLTREEIRSQVFKRNKPAQEIGDALELLERQGRIEARREQQPKGRPAVRYRISRK
jgi:hypothetical protein